VLGIDSQSNALSLSIRGLFISNYRSYELFNNLIFVITFSLFIISIYYFAKNVNKLPVRLKIFYFYIFLVSVLSLFGSYLNTRDLYAGSPIKFRWIMWVLFFVVLIYINFFSIVNLNKYLINGFLIFFIAAHIYEAQTAIAEAEVYSFYSSISSYIDVLTKKYFLVLFAFFGSMIFVSGRLLYLLNL